MTITIEDPATSVRLPTPARRRALPDTEALWLRIHLASLAAGAVILAWFNRNQWFFFDEWEFILKRGRHPSLGLFTPHNEHWSTVPALIYKALLLTVGIDSYWPYVAVVLAFHLALAHLIWRVAVRGGASPAVATAVAAIFAVLGAGGENLLWAFQMGFVGSVAFGWLAVLLHDHDGPIDRRDVGGWAALVTGLMCSGPAVTFIGITTLAAALRRRSWRVVALVGAVPAAAFATWWALAGRHNTGQVGRDGLNDPWRIVDFAWSGAIGTIDEVVGIPQCGAVIVLGVLLWWLRNPGEATGRASIALAGFVGAFGFFVFTGGARADNGAYLAAISRYVYVGAALLAPALAVVLSRVTASTTGARLVVLGLCATVAFHNVGLMRLRLQEEVTMETDLRRQVAAYDDFLDRDRRILPGNAVYLEHGSVQVTSDLLPRLADYDWEPGGAVSLSDQLNAELMWQTGWDANPGDPLDGGAGMTATGAAVAPVPGRSGCAEITPEDGEVTELTLRPARGSDEIRVRATAPKLGMLGMYLREGTTSSRKGEAFLGIDVPTDIVSIALDRTFVVTATQPVTLCGIQTP